MPRERQQPPRPLRREDGDDDRTGPDTDPIVDEDHRDHDENFDRKTDDIE